MKDSVVLQFAFATNTLAINAIPSDKSAYIQVVESVLKNTLT